MAAKARFLKVDARDPLPFDDDSFDAVICIDSINHMYERRQVFEEWFRVLHRGGRVLFTDPLTVTGMIRREEMLIRSGSLGEQVFTPAGIDQALLRAAGFTEVRAQDVTANMEAVSAARLRARAGHAAELDELEGPQERADYDRYLHAVELLASERRLTRIAYVAQQTAVGWYVRADVRVAEESCSRSARS